ncbi:MAG: hypothetical protein JWO77_2938 [Ilumatobacteraceae bacterium]|nr:hypothetical protein [Ilumatobacteraceae bacterium]
MRRLVLRSTLAVLAALVALSAATIAPAGAQSDPTTTTTAPAERGTTGPPDTPSGDPAIDDLVGCVQGSRQLLVLFLIDESASLKATDPDDRRVDAARGALDSLVALSSSEGEASPQVDVALAAFSNEYRLVQDWTPAGPDTAKSLNASLDSFADFKSGIDTDFVNALSAGRESLADEAAAVTANGGAAPCRAVMLFTDGGYDLAVRESKEDQERLGTTKPYAPGIELTTPEATKKAEARGRRELCDPGKLADRLRSDDITLLTVALSGDVARRSQYPLAAATTGKADDYTCGTQPKKGKTARVQGAYLPAEDIDVLVTQFNGVGTRLAGGNLLPGSDQVEICGAEPCEAGSRTFKLDGSLRRAQILALAPKPGTEIVLEGPDGDPVTISEAGTASLGDTSITTRLVAGRGYAIDLARGAGAESWSGRWTVSIVDPKGDQEGDAATLQIYVFSDIGVTFEELPPLERGASTAISVALDIPKEVEDEGIVKSADAEVRLTNPVTGEVVQVPLEGPPGGPFEGSYETPVGTTTNAMNATALVSIETTSGAKIAARSATTEILVRRPEGSVQFAPASLKMPSLTGEGSSEIQMSLIGGKGAGCVWFGRTDVPDAPEGASPVEVAVNGNPLPGESSCLKVPADGNVTISVTITPAGRAAGTVSGTLEVHEKIDGQKEGTTTQVPFRFDMARGVDQGKRLLLSVLLVIGGLGLPLLLLLLLNTLTARFQTLDAVRGSALPVRVNGRKITRTDGAVARPLALKADDFGSLSAAGSDRRFAFGGVEFRARASRNPFGATIAMAAPEGGAEKLKGREGSRVELDPALAGSWIFLLDSDRTRRADPGLVEGLLIAFVAEGDISTQTKRMLPDISDRLPDTAASLAGLVRETKRKTPSKKKRKAAADAAEAEAEAEEAAAQAEAETEADAPDAPAEAPSSAPDAGDAAGADAPADAPADDRTEPTEAAEPAEPAEPVGPTGFGGAAGRAAPSVTPPTTPAGGDDEPGGPPVGFSGARPD